MRTLEHEFFAVPDFFLPYHTHVRAYVKTGSVLQGYSESFSLSGWKKQQTLDTTSLFPGNIIQYAV